MASNMADIKKTIEIIFGATENVSDKIGAIDNAFTLFNGSVQGVAQPAAEFTHNLIETEAALASLAAALIGISINEAGQFSGSIKEIATLFNGTSEQAGILGESIQDYARDSVLAINDINAATYIAISTGTDWASVTTTLASAEQLAVAGATNLSAATGALSRSMNAYGAEANQAQSYSEALFTAVQLGDTTMAELAASIGRVASGASAAGVPFDELLAAVAGLTAGGVNTNMTMTQLQALMKELASPTDVLSKAMGGLTLKGDGLKAIMERLKVVTKGEFSAMDELFGSIEATNGALVLSADKAGVFEKAMLAMEQRTGKLTAAYRNMVDNFNNLNQNLVNNLKITLVQVGTPLLDEYGSAVKALSGLFERLGDSATVPNFGPIYKALEGVIDRFTDTINGVSAALPEALAKLDFSSFLEAMDELSEEFTKVFEKIFGEDLDLSRPEDLARALQSAINIITTLVNITKGVVEEFSPVFDVIGRAAEEVEGLDPALAKTIGNVLGALTAIGDFGAALGGAMILVKESKADIDDVLNGIVGFSRIIGNTLQLVFDSFANVIAGIVSLAYQALANLPFTDTTEYEDKAREWKLIAQAAAISFDDNLKDMDDSWGQLMNGLDAGSEKGKGAIEGVGDTAKEVAVGDISYLDEAMKEINKSLGLTSKEATSTAKSIATTGEAIKGAAKEEKEYVKVGRQMVEVIRDADGAIIGYGDSLSGYATKYEKVADKTKKATEEADSFRIKMEEIASNERIANVDAYVELHVANVEANAQIAISAFESISESVSSTNELIGNLFSQDAPDWDRFGFATKDAIEDANERANKLTEAQIKLLEAQSEYTEAQAAALNRGEPLIKIEADGLEPELEAFMWKIIEKVQMRGNAEGTEFLLGI